MKYRCLFSSRYGKASEKVVDTAEETVEFIKKYAKLSKEGAVEMLKDVTATVTVENSILLDIDPIYNNKSILIEGLE